MDPDQLGPAFWKRKRVKPARTLIPIVRDLDRFGRWPWRFACERFYFQIAALDSVSIASCIHRKDRVSPGTKIIDFVGWKTNCGGCAKGQECV